MRGVDPNRRPADDGHDDPLAPQRILSRFAAARARRATWESHWQDCYDLALPAASGILRANAPGGRRGELVYDGTAPDAVEQLAASLLAHLAPPGSRWFGFVPGPDLDAVDQDRVASALERAARQLQAHVDRSNLAVELHQSLLDLVVVGTGCLLVEEAPPGDASALRFTAVPLSDVVLEEGPSGRLDTAFRRSERTAAEIVARFPMSALPQPVADALRTGGTAEAEEPRFEIVEAMVPSVPSGVRYVAVLSGVGEPVRLADIALPRSPLIAFRWLKVAGEFYGRSPVMKALPDIRTANKVVELVLKNASIAVTGIWQADDDGVLNPAGIRLVPGAIIPKAVGSAGLTPLSAPGRFDVSQLVLQDLRARIRHALLGDMLAPLSGTSPMTATEVIERSGEMARLLGATYGRLLGELVTPLIHRALSILVRRGEIPPIEIDGRLVALQHRSPLARAQGQRDVQGVLRWLEAVQAFGGGLPAIAGDTVLDPAATARWLADAFGVPPELMRAPPEPVAAPPAVQPLSVKPLSAQPLSAQPLSAQPLSAQPMSVPPLAARDDPGPL